MTKLFPSAAEVVGLMQTGFERHWIKFSKFHKNKKKRHGIAAINVKQTPQGNAAYIRLLHAVKTSEYDALIKETLYHIFKYINVQLIMIEVYYLKDEETGKFTSDKEFIDALK